MTWSMCSEQLMEDFSELVLHMGGLGGWRERRGDGEPHIPFVVLDLLPETDQSRPWHRPRCSE